ncbi:MAG TPA: tyrosine-type recombinase/integrase [Candidatus Binataceae bacterium]|jgi:site-specific recombinase XerD
MIVELGLYSHSMIFGENRAIESSRSVVLDFKRILQKAKLPLALRFHDLRHSAASLLLAQGVQLRVIMELLGHSTIALTANTYSHVMPSMMQDVADKMDAILEG